MFDDHVSDPPDDSIDRDTGNFRTESERSPENREQLIRERVGEFLESDMETIAASYENETASVEIELDEIIEITGGAAITEAEFAAIRSQLTSEEAHSVFAEYHSELEFVRLMQNIVGAWDILEIGIKFNAKPAEISPETEMRNVRFENTCAYCDTLVTSEQQVPESIAGKWKKGKGKDKGREYRDWDLGEVECPTCKEKEGVTRKVFLYHREWRGQ
jgi:hypothetical protein